MDHNIRKMGCPDKSGNDDGKEVEENGCSTVARRYDPPRSQYLRMLMPVEVPEVIESDDTRVACDGGGGVLGHPKVYLEMGDQTYVECPYCDRRFVLREGAQAH